MNQNEIIAKVNEMMHSGFEIPLDKLTPTATLFDELGLDSLDAVDMLVFLEDKLQIKVDGEKVKDVRVMSDVYNLVFDVLDTKSKLSQ
jgi:acyl carrier protein